MFRIGTTPDGKDITLSAAERARHIHILGGIGTGKSKEVEYMVRQDIAAARGLCLLDPHGTLADAVEKWCAMNALGNRRIHLIKPGDPSVIPGFNPLRVVPGESASVRVDAMVGACAQAWGVESLSETPRLEKILRALFFALHVRGLTLAEGPALLRAHDPEGVRRRLTEELPDPVQQIVWNELNGLSRRDFADHVESAHTRLSKFLSSPAMRLMVGQKAHGIDFRNAMDKGEIVLVNLGSRAGFSYENARVLGTLLINDLFLSALGRDEKVAARRPFSLYVDEAADFLTNDVAKILDQTRKFGLRAVLAHQRIGQLRNQGENIFNAVMGSCQTKIVFGGLSDEDAEIMAREIMRGDVDLERPKSMTAPVVVGDERVWLRSKGRGHARSTMDSQTDGSATVESTSEATGFSDAFDEFGEVTGSSETRLTSTSTAYTSVQSSTHAEGESRSESEGKAEAFRSVREERPTHFYSLQESLHLAQLKLRNLPDRMAVVKRRGQPSVVVRTPEVRPVLEVGRIIDRFRQAAAARSEYLAPAGVVEAELDARRAELLLPPPKAEEVEFWTEE